MIIITARCQLDDMSVCYEVNVGLVQWCEWHWWIFGETPYSTSFLSDGRHPHRATAPL